jgi:SAM-dependent methyltransferase
MSDYEYVGEELRLFAHAVNWKSYFRNRLRPYLHGSVLEVGAGLGGTTAILCDGSAERWLALEPDARLAEQFSSASTTLRGTTEVQVRVGTVADLDETEKFDAILYIDVLEHIEHDREELERAARHLSPNGTIIVLSPAHQFFFSPFDQALGHFRRYRARQLRDLTPKGVVCERLDYLDSVGMLLSLGNKMLLKQSMPTIKQIKFWDRFCVPCSRIVDRLTAHRLGKSIVAIWRKPRLLA